MDIGTRPSSWTEDRPRQYGLSSDKGEQHAGEHHGALRRPLARRLLGDDVALEIDGDIDRLAVFHGLAAPDRLTIL
jgi:hypothetical protein